MIADPVIIVLDSPSPEVRQAVHEAVKNHTKDWWHHLKDVWIVGGHSAHFWGALISKVDEIEGFLVFELPKAGESRFWAASLVISQLEDSSGGPYGWLAKNYTNKVLADLKDLDNYSEVEHEKPLKELPEGSGSAT